MQNIALSLIVEQYRWLVLQECCSADGGWVLFRETLIDRHLKVRLNFVHERHLPI